MVTEILSADTLKLNFSLYTGLVLLLFTRVLAFERRMPSQYRAILTYGSTRSKQAFI